MEQEQDYTDGPSIDTFIDIRQSLYSLMKYRQSRNANHHKIKKRGRILREQKEFQFIEFDLQYCMMSKERKKIQKEALWVAQNLSFLSDPEEIQNQQKEISDVYQDQKFIQEKNDKFQYSNFNDFDDSYFENNPVKFDKFKKLKYSNDDFNNNSFNESFNYENNSGFSQNFLGSYKSNYEQNKNGYYSFENKSFGQNENSFNNNNSTGFQIRSKFTKNHR